MPFQLRSPTINGGGPVPERYIGDGANLSPPLEWSDPPPGTRSLALVVEDPDAPGGSFWHWGVYNIDAGERQLPEGAGDARFAVAINDFGEAAYGGPHPPRGDGPHHYHFRLVALDVETLELPPSAKVKQLWRAAQGHIVGQTELVATCER
ncbi:MAG: YbhB/YbcL family Raf kinase inhibitor-like protein [Devosia sp.]